MPEETEKPRNYRSREKIEKELSQYTTPSMQLRYIESMIHKQEDGKIILDNSTRDYLQDSALVIWEEHGRVIKSSMGQTIEYILSAAKEFEIRMGETEKAKAYTEHLESIAESIHPERVSAHAGLARKVGIYAGLFAGILLFSVSSMTGHVIASQPTTVVSQASIAVGVGLAIAVCFFLFSRKH